MAAGFSPLAQVILLCDNEQYLFNDLAVEIITQVHNYGWFQENKHTKVCAICVTDCWACLLSLFKWFVLKTSVIDPRAGKACAT